MAVSSCFWRGRFVKYVLNPGQKLMYQLQNRPRCDLGFCSYLGLNLQRAQFSAITASIAHELSGMIWTLTALSPLVVLATQYETLVPTSKSCISIPPISLT